MAKLARAQEHLEALDAELVKFFDSNPYGALGEIEGEDGWYVFRVKTRRQPPPRIGVLLGEYVHQVRSAFDHFAWALAELHTRGTPPSVIGFPIETSRTNFQKKARHRLDGHISPGWFAVIEAMQPYDAHDHALAILERLWNRDKHQTIIPLPVTETMTLGHTEIRPESDAITITERRPRSGVRLEDKAELARVKIATTIQQPHVDMYVCTPAKIRSESGIDLYWDIGFAESTLYGLLSLFPSGRTDPRAISNSALLLGQIYETAISTLPSEIEAHRRGFFVPDDSGRNRRPLRGVHA